MKKILAVILSMLIIIVLPLNISAVDNIGEIVSGYSTQSAATPFGYLDIVNDSIISGWAWRSDIPNQSIDVHIYIKNMSTNEEVGYAITANQYRSDLYSLGYGNGYHGFVYQINWDNFAPDLYQVTVYAIGENENNPTLNNSPMSYLALYSTVGYQSYAVYRQIDLNTPVTINWHAGLMNKAYANEDSAVIHVPGPSNARTQTTSWSGFISNNTYYGVYKPRQEIYTYHRLQIIGLARELATRDTGYTLMEQMDATINPDAISIFPNDIISLRCDGLIEYCYEYHGIRIYGNDSYWNISEPSQNNLDHHNAVNITPRNQAQNYMTKLTNQVPNP